MLDAISNRRVELSGEKEANQCMIGYTCQRYVLPVLKLLAPSIKFSSHSAQDEKPKGAMRESLAGLAATGLWLPPLLSGRVSFPLQLSNETLLHSAWSPYIVEFLSGENIFLNLLEYWYY